MRKLALAIPVLTVLAVLSMPDEAEAQARCRSNTALCLGDKNTKVVVGGNIEISSPDGGLSVSSTGAVTAPSLTAAGSNTFAGTTTFGTVKTDIVDAGSAMFNGQVQLKAPFFCGADAVCGSVALSSGTPSTATKTVLAGSTCVCWPVGTTAAIAAGGCAANVSSTTATFTGPNTVTTTVFWMCFK